MQTLILGASGYLGRHLYKNLKTQNEFVVGTYSNHLDKEFVKFDLMAEDFTKLDNSFTEESKCAIVCAGMTRIDSCLEELDLSWKINVERMCKVIQEMYDKNYHIIFCSTDSVFDGVNGNYVETDVPSPINEYGKMKVQVETFLQKNCPDACIVRLSKIIGTPERTGDVCADWLVQARNGKEIYCIKNNYLTFLDVNDAVECIKLLRNHKKKGIYHICGNERMLRKDACEMFFQMFGMNAKIYEKEIEFFKFKDKRPLDTSMNNKKICSELNYTFKTLEQTYQVYREVELNRE